LNTKIEEEMTKTVSNSAAERYQESMAENTKETAGKDNEITAPQKGEKGNPSPLDEKSKLIEKSYGLKKPIKLEPITMVR
jgi:hypothetical protein